MRRHARYLARRAPSMVLWVAVGLMLAQGAAWSFRTYADWAAAQSPASEVFEYFDVEYVGRDGSTLIFASDAVWRARVDSIAWVDRLECDGRLRSTLSNASGPRDPRPRARTLWDYTAAAPEPGRSVECRLVSTIVVESDGHAYVQRLESDPFTP